VRERLDGIVQTAVVVVAVVVVEPYGFRCLYWQLQQLAPVQTIQLIQLTVVVWSSWRMLPSAQIGSSVGWWTHRNAENRYRHTHWQRSHAHASSAALSPTVLSQVQEEPRVDVAVAAEGGHVRNEGGRVYGVHEVKVSARVLWRNE